MNKQTIVSQLIKIANVLDDNRLSKEANAITDVADRVAQYNIGGYEDYDPYESFANGELPTNSLFDEDGEDNFNAPGSDSGSDMELKSLLDAAKSGGLDEQQQARLDELIDKAYGFSDKSGSSDDDLLGQIGGDEDIMNMGDRVDLRDIEKNPDRFTQIFSGRVRKRVRTATK